VRVVGGEQIKLEVLRALMAGRACGGSSRGETEALSAHRKRRQFAPETLPSARLALPANVRALSPPDCSIPVLEAPSLSLAIGLPAECPTCLATLGHCQ
jgi:hypothetical protein